MRLPQFIIDRIKNHNTSLGENEVFPPEEKRPFEYLMLKKRFNEVCSNVSRTFGTLLEESQAITLLSKELHEVKEIERPIRPQLEKVCENCIYKMFDVPTETVNLKVELVDKLEPSVGYRLMPEDEDKRTFDFNDLDDFYNCEKVIMKRRVINALIQGASYRCSDIESLYKEEINKLNSELCERYHRINVLNDYILFIKEENVTDKKPMQGAFVEVMIGAVGEKIAINSQGLIFSFLLREAIRGFFEMFASHGLPSDSEKASYVLSQADFLIAEPWDLRIGVTMWDIIAEPLSDTSLLPYLFKGICEMKVDKFNAALKEVFARTKKGKRILNHMYDLSEDEVYKHSSCTMEEPSDSLKTTLNDAFLSVEEVDDYVIEEDTEFKQTVGGVNGKN